MQQLVLFDVDDNSNSEEDSIISDSLTKICRICNQEKNIDNFYLDRGTAYSKCKECVSEYKKLLNNAKINAPDKPADNRCECCGKITEKWYCDHYPNTEKFRGWICFSCNTAAGNVGDNYMGAVNLLNYLYNRKP